MTNAYGNHTKQDFTIDVTLQTERLMFTISLKKIDPCIANLNNFVLVWIVQNQIITTIITTIHT